jgi:hypothetical protein
MGAPNQQEAQNTWDRSLAQARKREVITAAATLTTAQSGALCLWNLAAGFTYTLPTLTAADIGTWYRFRVTVSATSVAHKVIAAAGQYLVGVLHEGILNTTPAANPGPKIFAAGGTDIAVSMAGSVTGGLIGTDIIVEACPGLIWGISGIVVASGTIETPFATS